MFAVDHAATALLIKRRFPSVSLTPMLLSVQAMELAWVGLNYLGIERTTTAETVRSVADIHLAYMPDSHSVATAVGAALLTWLIIEKGFGRAFLGRAVGLGIVSHLILDLGTHGHDIVLWPGLAAPKLGLGLYAAAPMLAFFVELTMGRSVGTSIEEGLACSRSSRLATWRTCRSSRPTFPVPSSTLAGRPLLLVTFIFVQIVVTLVLVGSLARRHSEASPERWSADHHLAAQHR